MSHSLAIACLSLFTVACASQEPVRSTSPEAAGPGALSARFPAAQSAIEIDVGERAPTLERLLQLVSQSTGVVYSYNEAARQVLAATRVALSAKAVIEPAQVYPWSETLLVQHGIYLGAPSAAEPPIVEVLVSSVQRGETPPPLALEVRDIAFCAQHPAVMVSTTIELPHLDVRTLGNSLRALTSDPAGGQNILPIAMTDSVVLSGSGENVAHLVGLLQRIDLAAASGTSHRDALAAEAAKANAAK